ncbi:zinc finger protein 282-like isoform X2 [Pleurodeles waltl]|uniref:zinc finger protein 282-like isoform X2 n=1 Tax=Pleurodeles waltl TaxID=8319 RepID=UPI003709A6E5
MLQQPSEKAAYHDVSAYFSEEEWSILQQWQEELHQNVMKEIDHALTSLGPVIATMVFSLRAKAEAEPCLMEDQRSERRRSSHTLPSCMIMNPDTLLRRTKNENLHLNGPLDTNDIGKKDCLSTEEQQTSIYIDDFGEEIGENSTDSHSGHDIISFYIKEEGETYYIDTHDHKQKESTYNSTVTGHDIISFCINEDETYFVDKQDSKNMETTRTSTDVGSETRKIKAGHLIAYTEKITGNVLHEEGERSMHQSPKKGANTKGQQWAGSNFTLQEEQIVHCKGGSVSQEYATLSPWTSDILGSDSHSNILPHLPNAKVPVCRQISYGPYACPECEKMFKTNQDLTRHQRTHSGERPYHCTECGKRFARSHHLTAHKRTHTGERPFQCTVCGKSFSLKGNLKAHHNTHLMAYRKQHKR